MTAIRKRRWILAIAAVAVVTGVAVFVVSLEDPKDVPRLVVLRQEQVNGEKRVVFRFDAPEHKAATLQWLMTESPVTGTVREPEVAEWGTDESAIVEAGESRGFSFATPSDDAWRLRCRVVLGNQRSVSLQQRVKACWRIKSFAPLRLKRFLPSEEEVTIESEVLTNAVPPTADAPRP